MTPGIVPVEVPLRMSLDAYAAVVGDAAVEQLYRLAEPLRGKTVVHINSTRQGGGVAEILEKMVPLKQELELDTHWDVIIGTPDFFRCTKSFHNGLQGTPVTLEQDLLRVFEQTNEDNARRLRPLLEEADVVFIHDPQPAPLLRFCPRRRGKWVWRCHVDASRPYRPVWRYLQPWVSGYDASIFSLAEFAQNLPHPQYLIPPSIDPLSDKNTELDPAEVAAVYDRFELDPERPLVVQVSRYDRFKDPVGVVAAYRLAKRYAPDLQLVLAGGGATDDPEGDAVLAEVEEAAGDDPDIHILLLPPDSHRTINALQRAADIIVQKSIREGFGLTVSEGMWKGKPVIGGNVGGIRLQVIDHVTGFLVNSPEGAALRIRYLLDHREKMEAIGAQAREFVREHFLLTRQLRDYLTVMIGLLQGGNGWIELHGHHG